MAPRLIDTDGPRSKLSELQTTQPSNILVSAITGEQLHQLIYQLWKGKGHDLGTLPKATISGRRNGSTWLPQHFHTNNNDLPLPSKTRAHEWLMTILNGPNMLLCICDHAETLKLLDALYDPQIVLSPELTCVVFWAITAGCRYSESSAEHEYMNMYETAESLLSERIDEETGSWFWLVQVLLLKCVYWLSEKKKLCWVTLGIDGYFLSSLEIARPDVDRHCDPHCRN